MRLSEILRSLGFIVLRPFYSLTKHCTIWVVQGVREDTQYYFYYDHPFICWHNEDDCGKAPYDIFIDFFEGIKNQEIIGKLCCDFIGKRYVKDSVSTHNG